MIVHLRNALTWLFGPFLSWFERYTRPARHRCVRGWLFEPVDVMIHRAALERLRWTHLSVDTAELDRKALTRMLETV